MSKLRYTASQSFHAISSAISATLSRPSLLTSFIVMMVVSHLRASFTACRGTCQPPLPICTRLVAGTLGRLVVEPRRGMHALVEVFFLDVCVPVEMDDADLLVGLTRDAAHRRKADGVIAAEDNGHGAAGEDVRGRLRDLVEGFFDIGGNKKHNTKDTKTQLLAQVYADLKDVRRVKRRGAAY